MIGIVAPLIGAWLILTAGPLWMFGAVAAVEALSALPLLAAPNVMPPREAPGAWRAAREGVALFLLDGWQGACIYYVWQVALFVSLGSSIGAFGGAMAFAALVGAILTALFGRHIDRGGGRRTAVLACVVTMALSLTQAAAFGHLWLAVAANALGAIATALIIPAISTPLYNLSQASPCPFRYNIATEGAWDIGGRSGRAHRGGHLGAGRLAQPHAPHRVAGDRRRLLDALALLRRPSVRRRRRDRAGAGAGAARAALNGEALRVNAVG